MYRSVYDVQHERYKLDRKLPPVQETLAQLIISSGRMRIDAEFSKNFQRLLLSEFSINDTFSWRELDDANLRPQSIERLQRKMAKKLPAEQALALAQQHIGQLHNTLTQKGQVPSKTELMLARALVLCNEPEVIQLIHQEKAEIFISFGQSVGDVMDVARWQEVGSNSGLQAVGGGENAVYISCGGNPFLSEDEYNHGGDGKSALARFLIIAAQETGHNADMVRNEHGQWIGRYSAIHWGREPSPKAGQGRKRDIARCHLVWRETIRCGLNRVAPWEEHLKFYHDKKIRGARVNVQWLMCKLGWLVMASIMASRGLSPLLTLQRSGYPCMQLRVFFSDMQANLTPIADVYKRGNPKEEEAVACIEAVARVPQQVIKWGHRAVSFVSPALYDMYYVDIIPACRKALKTS
jgi:hypothetical protein